MVCLGGSVGEVSTFSSGHDPRGWDLDQNGDPRSTGSLLLPLPTVPLIVLFLTLFNSVK